MLTTMDIGIDNAIAFQMSGKITQNDMTVVLNDAKEKIQTYGNIVIFEKIVSFEGIEIAAIVEEFKYLLDVGMSNIKKVAICTDKKWISHIANIEDTLFSKIDIKCFLIEEQTEAIQFLKQNG
jgi:hypothetical protein